MSATSRFTSLAKKFGMPYATTLWTDPKADPEFLKAIKQNRVVTLFSENAGTRKDYGKIGFHPGPNANFLIFPKTLPKGDDSRIVGIQYGALAPEPVRGKAIRPAKVVPPVPKVAKKFAAAPPRLEIFREPATPANRPRHREKPARQFSAILRRTAVWEQRLSVQARNRRGAKKQFEQAAKDAVFDPTGAKVETKITLIQGKSGNGG